MTQRKEMPFASVLTALFTGDDPPIHLLYRLSDLDEPQFAQFKRDWLEVSEDRRAELIRHMADIAEDNYLVDFTPLFVHAFADHSPAVRIAALDGLWDVEDPQLIAPIIGLLQNDPDVGVRAAAARALAHYIVLVEWGQIEEAHEATIVEALLGEYNNPRSAPELKRATLEAVSPASHESILGLIEDAYEEGSDETQLSAIFAMGNSADSRWLPILEQELSSPSPDFRAEAARACGMIGDPAAIEALEQLIDDDDLEVGIAAIYALGQIGGEEVFEMLSQLAEDPDYEEYYDAIDEALEEMEWVGGEFNLLSFADEEDDDQLPDDLRLN